MVMAGVLLAFGQDNIAAARAMGAGATVTVTGIVTHGDELGVIRYFQDETGGLAAYSSTNALADVGRGDEITITGTLKEYATLLEIDPVTSFTVNSSGNEVPAAVVLTPGQFAEAYEGMLVRVNEATISGSGAFARTSYPITANGETGQFYINSTNSPLIGTVIPTGPVSIIGPLGSYNGTYQLLPRDQFDILTGSVINLTSVPVMSSLSSSGFSVAWTTDVAGTSEAFYGNTTEMELGQLAGTGSGTSHSVEVSGLDPSEIIYLQPFSVTGQDTARGAVSVYVTVSGSTGDIKAYFNRPVDHSVSLGMLDAVYLDHAIDDTLIKYIDRAQESVDFTIYNFNNNGISNISTALNAAHDRGVTVRVIYDASLDAIGVESLNEAIGKIASPMQNFEENIGIMHNKFVVFDAEASDPDVPVVWTGATNFTNGQINTDPNNVVIIQDKSLALAFRLEFNEMFGSDGADPDPDKARFGTKKTDNTPHEFIINGKRVECYFSPSDGTHTKILEVIESADYSIHIATMLITKTDIGYDLVDKNNAGLDVKVLLNDYDQYGEPIVEALKASLAEDVRLTGEPGIMHHKYMIVDQANAGSDPILLTGSHNWSSSAQVRNDENTLIIHDQGVANAYYQDFVRRFSYGQIIYTGPRPVCENEFVQMNNGTSLRYDVLFNDVIPVPVTVSITRQPTHGTAVLETDNTITYTPEPGFTEGFDTVYYRVCLVSAPMICDEGIFGIYVHLPSGLEDVNLDNMLSVYPVPANDRIHVETSRGELLRSIRLYDQTGRIVFHEEFTGAESFEIPLGGLKEGLYYLSVTMDEGTVRRKVLIK